MYDLVSWVTGSRMLSDDVLLLLLLVGSLSTQIMVCPCSQLLFNQPRDFHNPEARSGTFIIRKPFFSPNQRLQSTDEMSLYKYFYHFK